MNIEATVAHHLLDHKLLDLFTIGGVTMSLSKHLITMWVVGLGLLVTLRYAVVGKSRFALLLRVGVEGMVLYLRDSVIEPLLGHDSKKYLHYFLSLFFFILACNLFGLVPVGDLLRYVLHLPFYDAVGGTATGNVAVTGGLALCTFGLICVSSIRALGPLGFIKNFIPVPHDMPIGGKLVLGSLMFVIELIGMTVKIFALTIRLFANMIAGHIVILGFMSLIFVFGAASQVMGVFVAGPFALGMVTFVGLIEILVAFLQAFIFTLLTAVFVGSMLHAH